VRPNCETFSAIADSGSQRTWYTGAGQRPGRSLELAHDGGCDAARLWQQSSHSHAAKHLYRLHDQTGLPVLAGFAVVRMEFRLAWNSMTQ
jgi:hypothetical protein